MEKGRYMLIHMNQDVYRFNLATRAELFAVMRCRGKREFYIIVDTEKNEVIRKWSY